MGHISATGPFMTPKRSRGDEGPRRSKRIKTQTPRYTSGSESSLSDSESQPTSSGTVVMGDLGKDIKTKNTHKANVLKDKKSVQFKTEAPPVPPSPISPMSPREAATLAHLADTMEAPKYWNYAVPTAESHTANMNSDILELLGTVARLGSTLDQVLGHLGVLGVSNAGLEDKAAAILKHLQESK
ncbi:hypothetical protein CspHIS471_0204410 [Cutaneotrichosporon sp. HIS471]|nr:hypothetical protein CspHIS471_0204410 [Cutaneotrichosporon sp. HIS471]